MHTRPMKTVTTTRLLGLGLAGVLALSGCSGGSDDSAAPSAGSGSASGSSSASASAEPYLPVPDGVELTAPGSELAVGESATVAYEPRQGQVGVLDIRVTRLEKTSFKESFQGWKLDDATRKTNPYFVRAKVRNVGESDLGGRNVPLYIVDGRNTLIEASSFASTFKPCANGQFPDKFKQGDATSVCLVYLSPKRGDLTAASFRPTQDFSPITWTGELSSPQAEKKSTKSDKKSDRRKGSKKSTRKQG